MNSFSFSQNVIVVNSAYMYCEINFICMQSITKQFYGYYFIQLNTQ